MAKRELSDVDKERLAKALRDYDGSNAHDVLNQDPNYTYFLAAKDEDYPSHPNNVSAMQELGYEVVNRENNSNEFMPFGTVKSPEGGAVQTCQHVLMRIPRELGEARLRRPVEIAQERVKRIAEEYEEIRERAESEENYRTGSGTRYFFMSGR